MPAWTDLREFIDLLESRGDLIRITDEVDWEYHAVGLTRQSSDIEGPALIFEKMRDSRFSCLSGLFGASRRVALALGRDYRDLLRNFGDLESAMIDPEPFGAPAPCQEVVIRGDDVNVLALPILRHFELDGGRYITAGLQVARDPETLVSNVSIHRQLPLDRNHLTVFAPAGRHLRTIIERWNDIGEPAEVAVVIGADPVIQIASQARAPFGIDEFAIAGGMRGAPVAMARGVSIDVEVPATAEMVIEGVIEPGRLEDDGPFGEYPGTYSAAKPAPVMRVTAITHRHDAMYQNTLTGSPMTENHWMMQPSATAFAYREALKITPEIRSINVTPGGTTRHHVVVSMRKRHPSEPRNIALALLASTLGAKLVVVVDEDVDPFDLQQVEWAVNTRMQPDRDVMIVPDLYSPTLDPSAPAARTSAKMGIDATAPLGPERRMYEPPHVLGVESWSLDALLAERDWSMPRLEDYLRLPG